MRSIFTSWFLASVNLALMILILFFEINNAIPTYLDGYPEVFFEFEVRNPCQAYGQLRLEPDKLQIQPENNKSYI